MTRPLSVVILLIIAMPALAQPGENVGERFERLLLARESQDQQVWTQEVLAQQYEQTFVKLWDQQRAADDAFAVAKAFLYNQIEIGDPGFWEKGIEGVLTTRLDANVRTISRDSFNAVLDTLRSQGYRVVQTEWHHATFNQDADGRWRSTFNVVVDLENTEQSQRLHIAGPITVNWSARQADDGLWIPDKISTTGLTVQRRYGPPVFERRSLYRFKYRTGYDDLIAQDLNGDGLSELIAPGTNDVFWNKGDAVFNRKKMCRTVIGVVLEGLFADFSGDGIVDYLIVGANIVGRRPPTRFTMFLYEGDGTGKFDKPPRRVIDRDVTFTTASGLTAGDIDGDGDLDLFVPQYKPPYAGGQFPTPYYNANDGYPSYVLQNQGGGNFVDVTEHAGITDKRHRRAYRSSLVDLDEDGDLDLIVVSDFAGIDIYQNDGQGQFIDITSDAIDQPENFGMSHTFGDFNTDGRLDFYVTGMASTTARRLAQMGAGREDLLTHTQMRTRIAYGNRMYLASATGGAGRYAQPAFRDNVARSGWSWGSITIDFNNDAFPDLYVANGNKSGKSAKDYCTRFWCHDIYSGGQQRDKAQWTLYLKEARSYTTQGNSWNGFEHNRLLMNLEGNDFVNVAFPMGAALEEDCRSVIADDFNNDGLVDLAVMSQIISQYRQAREVHLLINRRRNDHNWIGIRLGSAPSVSPMGARVTVGYFDGMQTSVYVTGDSFSAQQAPVKHFGLGKRDSVSYIQIRWPNGKVQRLDQLAINQYHNVKPQ